MANFEEFLMDSFDDVVEVDKDITMGGRKRKMKFKPIPAPLGDEIRKKCRKVTFVKGQKIYETDQDRYMANLIIETTTYPDLKNAELQSAWGVVGAEELLNCMKLKMTDGEYAEWSSFVNEINGYNKSLKELVEEAKN